MRGNSFKLKPDGVRLDVKKKFFTVRVVRPWHRWSREVVAASSLEVFKAGLDSATGCSIPGSVQSQAGQCHGLTAWR